MTGSTGFAVLRPKRREFEQFLYLAATSPTNLHRLTQLADGGAYPAVHPSVVLATKTVKVSEQLLEHFSDITRPLLDRAAACEGESATLVEIRDALLPKLISGELRIKDAERVLAKANV